jgi:hypothetical protein
MSRVSITATCFLVLALWSAPAEAGLDGYVDMSLSADRTEFRAPFGVAFYYAGTTNIDVNASLTGTASVGQTNPGVSFTEPFEKQGSFNDVLEGPTVVGACYYASLDAVGDPWGPFNSEERSWTAGPACNTQLNPPPPPPPPIEDTQECSPYCSPLVLDLDGDGIATTGADDPVRFDIDADGVVDTIGWLARDDDDAFLWRDVERNHRVDDGSELFGIGMTLPDGHRAANGFEALTAYDRIENGGNADGLITNRDAIWPRLRLWVDVDHDGVSDAGELSPIESSRVLALVLTWIESSDVDFAGNQLRLRGRYRYRLAAGLSEHRALVDVFFRRL